jgi:hypothetical protein
LAAFHGSLLGSLLGGSSLLGSLLGGSSSLAAAPPVPTTGTTIAWSTWCFATASTKDAHHVAYAAVSTAWNYLPGIHGKHCLKVTIRKWYDARHSANMLAEHVTYEVFSEEILASMTAWE